jgi:hypothetical protein
MATLGRNLIGATSTYRVSLTLDNDRIRRRFPRIAPVLSDGGRAVALVVAESTDKQTSYGNLFLSVVDSVCMGVERMTWTPVDSSYELTVARKLYEEKRSFRKPLRFDARREVVLADFELRDVHDGPYPMEVFGRDDAVYRARAAQKHAFYDDVYGQQWWSWDATVEAEPPPFPASRWRESRLSAPGPRNAAPGSAANPK